MLSAGLCVVAALLVICVTHWIYKWRNPKCKNGVLPPGSMGLPFIGETLSLIIPSNSLALHPFIKKRIERYGPVFRTNVAGRSLIVTTDPEFNYFIMQRDGKLVESWYLDAFAKVFAQSGEIKPDTARIHKYVRNTALRWFGMESLKDRLLPQIEVLAKKTLAKWSSKESIEVKSAAATVSIDFGAQQLFSYNPEKAPEQISELFNDLIQGLMSFPLNIPGTMYHKCLKNHKKVLDMMRVELKERRMSPDSRRGDLLDHLMQEADNEKFLTEEFIVQLMYSLIFVFSDSLSTTLALAVTLLHEHPLALQELTAEHEAILKKKENPDSPLTWDDYKSMTFTLQVINETLRLANISPGLFRKATEDIQFKGYTIPAGWPILVAAPAVHLNSTKYEDPLTFNPWRWKELQSSFITKSFMPFGFGLKQCAGAEYSRVLLSTFLHTLVSKYRWTKVKDVKFVRGPILKFPNGFQFKISAKNN
uniref:Cytochrome P450 n=1 Tax=Ilex asprella TaxID=185493 RepID=A0A976SHZ4_9AQUA|nr:cytochrome P450 [Ilex asprella]